MNKHNIAPLDLIVANLYPFAQTVAAGTDFETCVENIDIGSPTDPCGCKNHPFVTVVTDHGDYDAVALALEGSGTVDAEMRQRLAQKAFQQTAAYDQMIAGWLTLANTDTQPEQLEDIPNLSGRRNLIYAMEKTRIRQLVC